MPKMRHQSARRSRPMSPKELRELYGVPVMQIKTSEDNFRRESYKRDKQRLRKVVDAIDAEKRQVERLWDVTRSRFVQEHQDLVHPPNRKQPVYRKVASFQGLSVNAVPPCIPFLGTFPPNRHPSTVRRVTDMDKEPLFSRGVLPEFDSATDDSFQYCGRTPDNILQHEYLNQDGLPDDFNFFLANRRILHTTGMGVNGTATTRHSPFLARSIWKATRTN